LKISSGAGRESPNFFYFYSPFRLTSPAQTVFVETNINTKIEMKKVHFALRTAGFACIALIMSSASCELFQAAENINFTVILEHEFVINETVDNPDGADYATKPEDEILDAAKINKDFAEHANMIEDVKINKVTYVLSGYSSKYPGISFSNGTLTFSNPDAGGSSGSVVTNYSVPNLEALSTSGAETELVIDAASADAIATMIKEDKKVRIHAAGRLSSVPLYLKVMVKVDCTLTARII
jgi:hypothetical protein